MTSRISFSKISMENLRRRSASVLVTIFICLMQLLAFVMQIQNTYAYDLQAQEIKNKITELSLPGYGSTLIALFIGLYLAFDGLRALHSRQQSDLFGSLPFKRETEYKMILLNSFLIILLPTAVCTVLRIIILGAIGQLSGAVIGNLFLTLLFTLLAFLASWVTAALAIVMTGHPFVGLLGYGVFASYLPLIVAFLIPAYADTFFSTSDFSSLCGMFSKVLNYFSPCTLAWGLLETEDTTWTLNGHVSYIIGIIIWIAAIGAISYILYLRRPSEAAGRAMTFKKANPVIRFLIVIPMALYTGLYLQQMSFTNGLIWLFAGVLGGAAIFHSIVECIYQFDIRGVLSRKKQLAAAIVICFAFVGAFMADIVGYDKWIPEKEQIASIDISFNNVEIRTEQYWGQKPDGITGDALDATLELVKNTLSDAQTSEASKAAGIVSRFAAVQETDDNTISMTITYNMKDGKEKKRLYSINTETQSELIDQIYATEDFKNDYYSLYTADRGRIKKIEWDNSLEFETLKLTEDEQNELIDTYLEELTSLSYSDTAEKGACSMLTITHSKAYMPYLNGYSANATDEYYIYPTFTKTLAFLRKKGLGADPLSDYRISGLEIAVSDENYENEISYQISDPDVIAKYKNDFILTMYDGFGADYDDHYTITAYADTPAGINTLDVRVPAGVGEKLVAEAEK